MATTQILKIITPSMKSTQLEIISTKLHELTEILCNILPIQNMNTHPLDYFSDYTVPIIATIESSISKATQAQLVLEEEISWHIQTYKTICSDLEISDTLDLPKLCNLNIMVEYIKNEVDRLMEDRNSVMCDIEILADDINKYTMELGYFTRAQTITSKEFVDCNAEMSYIKFNNSDSGIFEVLLCDESKIDDFKDSVIRDDSFLVNGSRCLNNLSFVSENMSLLGEKLEMNNENISNVQVYDDSAIEIGPWKKRKTIDVFDAKHNDTVPSNQFSIITTNDNTVFPSDSMVSIIDKAIESNFNGRMVYFYIKKRNRQKEFRAYLKDFLANKNVSKRALRILKLCNDVLKIEYEEREKNRLLLVEKINDMLQRLGFTDDSVHLDQRISVLESLYIQYKETITKREQAVQNLLCSIKKREELLNISQEVSDDITEDNIDRLNKYHELLIDEQTRRLEEIYNSTMGKLHELCELFTLEKRVFPITNEGIDEMKSLIDDLEPKKEMYMHVVALIQKRNELIDKMNEFEKIASDPRRLFKSSFQLISEEKFRKSAYPTLMKIEKEIFDVVDEYYIKFGDFIYEGCNYKERLRGEIDNRIINRTVFVNRYDSPLRRRKN